MRLLLFGEHVLLLQALKTLIEDQIGAEVRVAARLTEVEAAVLDQPPDVLLIETSDVPASAALLRQLRGASGDLPLLIIAPDAADQLLAALRLGARGFVGRNDTAGHLATAVEALQRGEWSVPPGLIGALAEAYLTLAAAGQGHAEVLSEREQRIIHLLVQGATIDRISSELFLSPSSVRSEIHALQQRFSVGNRMQLVTEAIRRGIVSLH